MEKQTTLNRRELLTNISAAEWLPSRSLPGMIPEQITTFFGGGCGFDAMGNPTGPCLDELVW